MAGNALFLIIFGVAVERELGWKTTLIVLFGCHFVSCLVYTALHNNADIILSGASGGISGLFAFFTFLNPKRKIAIHVRAINFGLSMGYGLFPRRWKEAFGRDLIPAWVVFSVWMIVNLAWMLYAEDYTSKPMSFIPEGAATLCRVAYSAHISGSVVGMLAATTYLIRNRGNRPCYYDREE
jgi:membrane associated rhomboid family serine protease